MTTAHKPLPHIGARIVKSSVGAALCILIYYLRELLPIGSGIPFYSVLSVLWCIQPYTTSTKTMAKQRTIGTVIGAVYGLAFLLFFGLFDSISTMVVYLAASAMIVPILYTTVLIHRQNASYFSCVVFLSIAITHSFDANPYLFVFNRVLDTLVGIGVGVFLNTLHHPVRNKENALYVSGIDAVLVSSRETMLPYNKVELNRLIALGAKITVSTVRTPASMIDLLSGIDLKLPVIAMDGAVLYDIKENRYLDVFALEGEIADRAEKIIEAEGAHAFCNVLCDNTLLIYYGEFKNAAERDLFEKLRRSPYRNYTGKRFRSNHEHERVIYLMTLVKDMDAERITARLDSALGSRARIVRAPASEYEGYTYIKIYSPEAHKSNMLKILKERTGAEKVVTFGSIPGQYDVYVHDDGGNAAVKAIKKLFEGRQQRGGQIF